MKINEIIKDKRNAEGLTQEQVADYLGVSTPAVNKWEKGSCYPDITILPALARLLKVDLNTLLSFKEDLSEEEINKFANELVELVSTNGFDFAFEKAMDKIHEYPNCNKLALTVASILHGSLYMFNIQNKECYEENIEKLYIKVADSDEFEIKNQAISMIINKYLHKNEYDKAQVFINKLPDITYDKKRLQGNLYSKCGELDKASEVFEERLILATTNIFETLMSMMEIALKEGRNEDAKHFADTIEKTTKLYDLWDYNSYVPYFQLYIAEEDADKFVTILKSMINSMTKKWDISKSKLYKHIKIKQGEDRFNGEFISNFMKTLMNNNNDQLSFLKDNKEFNELLNNYFN